MLARNAVDLRVAVFGAGTWGTTIAKVIAPNVQQVLLVARDSNVIRSINVSHVNEKFLPGIILPENVRACEIGNVTLVSDLVIWGIPVQFMRERLIEYRKAIDDTAIFVNLSKGLERNTGCRPSQILREFFPKAKAIASLGGPNIASDVAIGKPAVATIALESFWDGDLFRYVFNGTAFRVDLIPDIIALELVGALKNIIAIAAGVADGLNEGINFKASIVSQGFEEIRTVSRVLGANPDALMAPFGLGDLLATCFSEESRNRRFGEYLGNGLSAEDARIALAGRVAEGVETAFACSDIIERVNVACPILSFVRSLLLGEVPPSSVVALL